ncbi:LysR family transcriptional regulator [Salmonella bongori CFSAN000509]|uniref:LysR family transcriptional regulator n=3 Tax=Salmonella TaxID=590 RepID=A0A750KHV5_SALER|nr:LysR family transcripitonal regulator [Salmonella bongori serovar 48:z41:-- str. RKS3044]EGS1128951.1 LysR family transcriptional regulator [Salmonella bongori CFSAN000509]HAC6693082.1 LysR family transcriptional regulator [Salmonella bongori serovar 44:r:-]
MMDKIYAMKLFIRVAERESFSRAAEEAGLPTGSISRQIQALENQLGIRLLHRTTRRVQLTQDGMIYYERAKDLLSNLDELESFFQPDPASISGKIRVDIPSGLANSLIMPRLPTFLHHYPGIALELCSGDRQIDVLREDFDCVVRTGPLHAPGILTRPLGNLTMVNCASPQYLERFGYPESLNDLTSHAMVHYSLTPGVSSPGFALDTVHGMQWVKTGGMLTVNSTETWYSACLAGLGIIQTPRVTVREALRAGMLVEILPQYRASPLPVTLLYPHRRNLSRRVHLFMTWLTEAIKDATE